jgi:hypothetical protein
MTILSRHLYREFFLMAAACILGCLVLFLVIDFMESADNFLNNRAAAGEILRYYMLKIPGIFIMTSPVAVLVAVLITVAVLARNNEFTAMFSVGVGPMRAFAPLIAGCALISALSLGTSEILAPKANRMAREIARLRVRPGRVAAQFSLNRYWIRGENAILSAQVIDTSGRILHGFQYLEIDRNFRLVRRIDARVAEYKDAGKWRLREGRERYTDRELQAVPFAERDFVFAEAIQGFMDGETPPGDVRAALRIHRGLPGKGVRRPPLRGGPACEILVPASERDRRPDRDTDRPSHSPFGRRVEEHRGGAADRLFLLDGPLRLPFPWKDGHDAPSRRGLAPGPGVRRRRGAALPAQPRIVGPAGEDEKNTGRAAEGQEAPGPFKEGISFYLPASSWMIARSRKVRVGCNPRGRRDPKSPSPRRPGTSSARR